MRYRIHLVDDHTIFRSALAQLLGQDARLNVVGSSESAATLLRDLDEAFLPDLVIVDLSLPDMPGLELIAVLRARHPGLRMLVLSGQDEWAYRDRALHAGALGFVGKHRGSATFLSAVHSALGLAAA